MINLPFKKDELVHGLHLLKGEVSFRKGWRWKNEPFGQRPNKPKNSKINIFLSLSRCLKPIFDALKKLQKDKFADSTPA